jgi:hypothetical protein
LSSEISAAVYVVPSPMNRCTDSRGTVAPSIVISLSSVSVASLRRFLIANSTP